MIWLFDRNFLEMAKEIKLTNSKVALVDDEDYENVMRFRWYSLFDYNRYRAIRTDSQRTIYLHRFILGLTFFDKKIVDHINGDGLDNRRENLRIVTHRQNILNRKRI
jgi:hypothetical protein